MANFELSRHGSGKELMSTHVPHLLLCIRSVCWCLTVASFSPQLRDPSGAGTPLHFASASRVAFNQTRILAALLSAGADVNSVHANWRRTPLHYACYRGNTDAASQLIRASASVNPVDVGGHTPLHVAAYYGHYEIVKLLLSKGCNPDAETSRGRKAPVSAVTLALARGAAGVPDVARIIKLLSEHSPQARRP